MPNVSHGAGGCHFLRHNMKPLDWLHH